MGKPNGEGTQLNPLMDVVCVPSSPNEAPYSLQDTSIVCTELIRFTKSSGTKKWAPLGALTDHNRNKAHDGLSYEEGPDLRYHGARRLISNGVSDRQRLSG